MAQGRRRAGDSGDLEAEGAGSAADGFAGPIDAVGLAGTAAFVAVVGVAAVVGALSREAAWEEAAWEAAGWPGWPEDKDTVHWLENRGAVPAVEISVDVVQKDVVQKEVVEKE